MLKYMLVVRVWSVNPYLRSRSGMASAFLAMNKVFGEVYEIDPAEAEDQLAGCERYDKNYRSVYLRCPYPSCTRRLQLGGHTLAT